MLKLLRFFVFLFFIFPR